MKNNIFEKAKFGDKFLTRIGTLAIYKEKRGSKHTLLYLNEFNDICIRNYKEDGIDECIFGGTSEYDIVSKYQEPIDENKLDELTEETMDKFITLCDFDNERNRGNRAIFKGGFKTGYRKAKDE